MQYIVQPVLMNNLNKPVRVAGKKYTLSALNSGFAVAVRTSDTWVVQTAWKDSEAQTWQFEDLGDGLFKVIDVATGMVLTRVGESYIVISRIKYPRVMARAWAGTDDQRWALVNRGGSTFSLQVKSKGSFLHVPDGNSIDGQELVTAQWLTDQHKNRRRMFRMSEVVENKLDQSMSAKVTLYEHGGFGGTSQDLGPGSFKTAQLAFTDVSSVRVPEGLRVTLHKSKTFDGERKSFDGDTDYVGDDMNDQSMAVVVEPVVTVYDQPNFEGSAQRLVMGQYEADALAFGEDAIRSVRVPLGMQVELYSDPGFKGESVVITWDAPDLGSFLAKASSAMVKITGTAMPDRPLKFGERISLTALTGNVLRLRSDEVIEACAGLDGEETFYTIVRAGPTMNQTYVAFGDVVALKAENGKYLSQTGPTRADADSPGNGQQWVIYRAGETDSRTFAAVDDVVAFRRAYGNTFLTDGHATGQSWNDRTDLENESRWELRPYGDPRVGEGAGSFVTPVCGAQAFSVAVCGADVCTTAVCGAQAAIVNACGAASVGVVICGVDIAGVTACGAFAKGLAACGGNLCGVAACAVAACGADGCGGAACATAVCGGAACGGNGCGGNACAVDACPANLCGAAACGGNACAVAAGAAACPIAACGANACAIDLCPADLCAADACAIDIIPIIPGI